MRLDAAAESLAQFHQPKQASPTADHTLPISTDVMVQFLEFILENPQTNSAHAFSAFQRGELANANANIEPSVAQEYEFEEMESPEVLYDDEYESDFYTNFDDDMFDTSNWTTSWEDPSVDWLQQAHIDANHGFNKHEPTTTMIPTTLDDILNPTTSTTTTTTTTTKVALSKPIAQLLDVENDKIAVSWSRSDINGARVAIPINYRVNLYERSTRRLLRSETTSELFVTMDALDADTEYAVQVQAIVDDESVLESGEAEVVVTTSPAPPKVTTTNVGPTALRIHWSRIVSALSYVVTVLDAQGEQVFSDFKFPSFDSMDVRNLYPNAQYDIIVSFNGNKLSRLGWTPVEINTYYLRFMPSC